MHRAPQADDAAVAREGAMREQLEEKLRLNAEEDEKRNAALLQSLAENAGELDL